MSAPPSSETNPHVAALDGLRGVAATIVVLRHTFNAIPMPVPFRREILESPLALVLNAQGAVQLFFVLSGWVLAASLTRRSERAPWIPYYARRVLRIHVPYASAILLAWIASAAWTLPPGAAVTPWLARSAAVDVSPAQFASALAFPGTAHGLLPVGWTLRLEMIYSVAVPLLLLAARPGRGLALLCASAFAFAAPWADLWYVFDFALGVVLFREQAWLDRTLAALGAPLRALLLLVACVLFSAQVAFATNQVVAGTITTGEGRHHVAMAALASALFVAAVAGGYLPVFAAAPIHFVGRISYSMYLLHRTILTLAAPRVLAVAVVQTAAGPMRLITPDSAAALFAIVLGLSVLVSIPHYRLVEEPCIALGARAARRLDRRRRPAEARLPGGPHGR